MGQLQGQGQGRGRGRGQLWGAHVHTNLKIVPASSPRFAAVAKNLLVLAVIRKHSKSTCSPGHGDRGQLAGKALRAGAALGSDCRVDAGGPCLSLEGHLPERTEQVHVPRSRAGNRVMPRLFEPEENLRHPPWSPAPSPTVSELDSLHKTPLLHGHRRWALWENRSQEPHKIEK